MVTTKQTTPPNKACATQTIQKRRFQILESPQNQHHGLVVPSARNKPNCDDYLGELERLKHEAKLGVVRETVLDVLEAVNRRMVQFYSKSVPSHTLGVISREHVLMRLGDPHSTTTKWRPDRSYNGRGHQETILQWHYEHEVGTIPLSKRDWHNVFTYKTEGAKRKLNFRIVNIMFNYDTKTMAAVFMYEGRPEHQFRSP